MVLISLSSDGLLLICGVLGIIYTTYVRDLFFRRKAHREIDLTTRTLNRPQRFVERAQRFIWTLLCLQWLYVAFVPSTKLFGSPFFASSTLTIWLTFLLALLFFFLMNLARSTLESFGSWREGAVDSEKTELVTDSIYLFCRHPFSLFSLLEALSLWLLAPYGTSLVLILLLATLQHIENLFEEDVLLKQHPSEYAKYCAHVWAYMPHSLDRIKHA